eukprot:tig00021434_g21324.t1
MPRAPGLAPALEQPPAAMASSSSPSSSRALAPLRPAALDAPDDGARSLAREVDPEVADPRDEMRRLGIGGPEKKQAKPGDAHGAAVPGLPAPAPGTYAQPPAGHVWHRTAGAHVHAHGRDHENAGPGSVPVNDVDDDEYAELYSGAERRPIPAPPEVPSGSSFENVPHKRTLHGSLQSASTRAAAPLTRAIGERWAQLKELATWNGLRRLAKAQKITILCTTIYAVLCGTLAHTAWKDKLGFKGHIMLVILYFLMFALIKDFAAGLAFLAALTACLMFDIVSQSDALAGFSNAGVFQVGVLYVIAAGIEETGALDYALRRCDPQILSSL